MTRLLSKVIHVEYKTTARVSLIILKIMVYTPRILQEQVRNLYQIIYMYNSISMFAKNAIEIVVCLLF